MSKPIALNTHRGLSPGELTRKYREARDAVSADEIDADLFYEHLDAPTSMLYRHSR